MQMTLREAITATSGLRALGAMRLPFPLAIRVARLRQATQVHAKAFEDARDNATRDYAKLPEGEGFAAVDTPNGGAAYKLTPADTLALQRAMEAELASVVTVDGEPLTTKDFPDKLGGQEFAVEPETLAALGPLFTA